MHAGTVVTVCRQLYTTFVKVYSRDRVCFRIVFFLWRGVMYPVAVIVKMSPKWRCVQSVSFTEDLSAVASIPTLERRGERMLAVFPVFWWGGTWTLVTRPSVSVCLLRWLSVRSLLWHTCVPEDCSVWGIKCVPWGSSYEMTCGSSSSCSVLMQSAVPSLVGWHGLNDWVLYYVTPFFSSLNFQR